MAVPELSVSEEFKILREDDPFYAEACKFTAAQYEKRLACELTTFYPVIFVRLRQGKITGVCGLRGAAKEPLFLEQYLQHPVERCVQAPERKAIVELGGFSALNRAEAFMLMKDMAPALLELGFKTVVCTANRPVRGCLRRLGIRFRQIGEADQSRLEQASSWGRYYKTMPLVLAGDIESGADVIGRLMKAAT